MSEEKLQEIQTIVRRIFIIQIVLLIAITGLILDGLYLHTKQLNSIMFSLLAGCGGGSIALIQRLHNQKVEALHMIAYSWYSTLMPVAYAGGMALVAYLLFMGGILTGEGGKGLFTSNLFPNFYYPPAVGAPAHERDRGEKPERRVGGNAQPQAPERLDPAGGKDEGKDLNWGTVIEIRPKGIAGFAKLLVWCFLAGYSEQFIGRLLGTLERQGGGKPN
jgi:hypothetical protein